MVIFVLVLVVVAIIAVVVLVKVMKKKRQIKELMDRFEDELDTLVVCFRVSGYNLSDATYYSPGSLGLGYTGSKFVYRTGAAEAGDYVSIGTIEFATYPAELNPARSYLRSRNSGAYDSEIAAGKKKHFAIEIGRTGILFVSDIATTADPPDIPGWLMVAAKYMSEGYEIRDPDWVNEDEHSNPKSYLNVMFR